MRNPDRIEPFMNKLAQIWKKSAPDMRFSQFMMNIFSEFATKGYDPFYWEEKKFLEALADISWIKMED